MSEIWVEVIRTRGSAPRDAGTAMRVTPTETEGTIGGGALEYCAIQEARDLISQGKSEVERSYPLGPELGQCCGGAVTLSFASARRFADQAAPIWIWGAGHVGRALALALAPLDPWHVTLVDDASDRLPGPVPQGVTPVVAADMPRMAAHAPGDAAHFIMTYSHEIDLALCDALLRRGFRSCGLIGSATKKARFQLRLQALGHANAEIGRITCPIGDPALGKEPQAIAIGVAARLLSDAKKDRRD